MNVDIAYRLSKLRRDRGLSQESLANQLGVSRQAVSKWERAESSPDTDNLIALADLYGMSLDDLLKGDPEAHDLVDASNDEPAVACDVVEGAGAPLDPEADSADGCTNADKGSSVGAREAEPTHVSFSDGIDVHDGGDHVHMNWRDGINVHDHAGTDVHVGLDGIHVSDPGKGDHVDMGSGGAFRVSDHDGNEVHADSSGGFTVNGEHCESWNEAQRHLQHHHTWMHRFPCGWIALIAFICMGVLGGMWREGLVVLFSTGVWSGVSGVADAFCGERSSRRRRGAVTGLVGSAALFAFLSVGLLMGLWHPGWVLILVGIAVCALIKAFWRVDEEPEDGSESHCG
ncbi:MAG: helix-turn-helix domain-containing protein [Atopobiaceae bacterium]|nr:helix-turn-helix domain-containing protein [Atopobiaceae bacterium]MCH4180651.1 helix-turn-helix domain-containing protein [Atopobiaceae bacterium]MCH4214668.1 helix-turn-helix domain-containing protein [Atopobiaceae bacterium]MCH4230601.1 helix-turn-helix domain-containing protein [Atopobiaceae bacterium]MCH4276714.1 helix-turn-helix domain-containing protein [Atopobiaceae bacterium]